MIKIDPRYIIYYKVIHILHMCKLWIWIMVTYNEWINGNESWTWTDTECFMLIDWHGNDCELVVNAADAWYDIWQ